MNRARFQAITKRYAGLRVAVVGDFCLDRYLEIDPRRAERSIETGLPVHNIVRVRAQAGAAGTILNNLVALGVGKVFAIGFCGDDGEGYELRQALAASPIVSLEHFFQTRDRRTFTYTKPLALRPGQPPRELNRLDLKNWTSTPRPVRKCLAAAVHAAAARADALIVLDQVDVPHTGVVSREVLEAVREAKQVRPELLVLADSRRGLRGFPPVVFKMNAAELAAFAESKRTFSLAQAKTVAAGLAAKNGQPVFVTLAQRGMLGASPDGTIEHCPARPVRGPIDIVGAGDAVTANLTVALASGAKVSETLELANAAASVVIHKLGTTGTATVRELRATLPGELTFMTHRAAEQRRPR